jgi:hypothetical protein
MLPQTAIPVEAADGHPKACLAFNPNCGVLFHAMEVAPEGGATEALHVPPDTLLDPLPDLSKSRPWPVEGVQKMFEFFVTQHVH